MRIVSVTGYAIRFAFVGGSFSTSYGRRTALANILLVIGADDGSQGFGEICQLSSVASTPLDDREVDLTATACANLIGLDSRDIVAAVAALGAGALSNLRCGVDTALWDMMGGRAGQPLFRLFGGRAGEKTAIYATLSSEAPDEVARNAEKARQKGIGRFQLKIEGHVDRDIARIEALASFLRPGDEALVDANGGYDVDGGRTVAEAAKAAGVMFEEPCTTFEENLEVARATGCPVVLDQCMNALPMYVRAIAAETFAGVGVKPTNLGGLSVARSVRDLCIASGLPMKVDDMWAADTGSLGVLHLAAGVPQNLLLASVDMRPYFDGAMFTGGPAAANGMLVLDDTPGLGLSPIGEQLGEPLFSVS
ncbi:MAG: mandelate racemase/muconate lactonizing enzyme family protein [Pseudomonadota bacterium]